MRLHLAVLALGLFLGYFSTAAFACGTDVFSIEAWQPSASGAGYDVIFRDSVGQRFYVPEDGGIMTAAVLAKGNQDNWDSTLKAGGVTEVGEIRAFCESPAAENTMLRVKSLPLLEASLEKLSSGLPAQAGTQEASKKLAEVRAGLKSLDGKVTARSWCSLLEFLEDGVDLSLTYEQLKPGQSFANLDPAAPTKTFNLRAGTVGTPMGFSPYIGMSHFIVSGSLAPGLRGGCTARITGNLPSMPASATPVGKSGTASGGR